MAELVGLVASSIAIVETAGKVAGAVLTLKKLWDEIQDVPDTIRNLMTEIEVLEPILTVIEDDYNNTGTPIPNDRASNLALAYCRKAVTDLEDLVRHLSVNLQAARRSKRGKAKVRVILEKDTLKKLQDRMQAAVRLLTLAQQTYLVALTRSQPEIIFRRLESTSLLESNVSVESPRENDDKGIQSQEDGSTSIVKFQQPETRTSFLHIAHWRTAFGNVGWGRGKEDGNTLFGWMTRFEAPSWLSQRAWDLRITHSTSGWQMNLKPYCVRPDGDQVFDHVRNGDTQALGWLIRSGRASIYDIDKDGWSLLHWFYGSETPAHYAIEGITYEEENLPNWPELDRLLTSVGAYEDIDDLNPWRPGSRQGIKGDNKDNHMSRCVEEFEFFQPVYSPNHNGLNICERLDYGKVQWDYGDDVLRFLLFNGGTVTTEQIQALEKSGIGPLNLIAFGYHWKKYRPNVDPRLTTLVHEMIRSEANVHFEQHPHALPLHMRGVNGYPFSTPFFGVLIPAPYYYYYDDDNEGPQRLQEDIERVMLNWLEDLYSCGIDLSRYGKHEMKVFRKNRILRERWYPWDQWMQLSGFKYGPKPEDWVLEWDLMPERLSGEFWSMVEEQLQHPQMPGAWVDSAPTYLKRVWVGYYDACESSETSDSDTG
ncbi:hypothetical protein PFICI_01968 [Pestalotiopsis fici W106-1]|uniref:NACHT-NTPase and P-loop NTPases N-terminal domain-containing protein n=1 Tax=Pestalotiopsis fici (strain W106-1 / CGMCC3.15140) TaxID=1229662 RepID=W3XQ96_PESFW|nr:uncharacterized protein PFICI_01968 [Pestalotiopsis fici W106-1]ETS88140.1 hypothetical protein PFICI_01968 [Pestalotiopsis fici W106-1]